MPGKSLYSEAFDDGSLFKLKILKDYFKEWLPVFVASNNPIWNKMQIFDLFAGAGKDISGVSGSPLILIDELNRWKTSIQNNNLSVVWLSSSYLFVPKKNKIDTAVKGKAAVIEILSDAYDMGMMAHKNLSGKQLDVIVPFFAGPMTRRQILILMHDHQTHHLGQLIVYLRLKGIKPPDYVGWQKHSCRTSAFL